jgi:hypothetical protein
MTLQWKVFGNLKPELLRMLLLPSPARLTATLGLPATPQTSGGEE